MSHRWTSLLMTLGFAFRDPFRFKRVNRRRGQTRVESAVALVVLLLAGVGAWMLYKDAIIETTKAMIGFFGSKESG